MRKSNLYFVAFVALLIAALISGCDGDGNKSDGSSGGQISSEQLLSMVDQATQDLEQFQFEMDMTMDMQGWDGEEEEEIDETMTMEMKAAMDISQKKAYFTMNMNIPEEEQEPGMPENIQVEMFLIDNVMYMNMGEWAGGWMKAEMPESELEDTWEQQNWTRQQTEMLLDAANVTIVGESKVNGIDCYEVSMEPDIKELLEMVSSQVGDVVTADLDPSDIDDAMDTLKDFSMKQWYDKKTFLPIRMEMEMSIFDEGEDIDMTMRMETDMKYSHLNEAVDIELPPEAKNAPDMTDLMMQEWE